MFSVLCGVGLSLFVEDSVSGAVCAQASRVMIGMSMHSCHGDFHAARVSFDQAACSAGPPRHHGRCKSMDSNSELTPALGRIAVPDRVEVLHFTSNCTGIVTQPLP